MDGTGLSWWLSGPTFRHARTVGGASQALDWDARDKPTRVTEAGKVTDSVYDTEGNRLLRRDPTATTVYLGNEEIRLDRTGAISGTRYYTHAGSIIASRTTAGLSWLAADHQQTLQLAVDSQTQTVSQRRQLPFGAPRGNPVAFPNEKGLVGGTIDSSTGLTHIGARSYDAATGRFVSVDPLLDPSDPQQLQGYAYSNNSPLTFSDPTHPKDHTTKHNVVAHQAGDRIAGQAILLGKKIKSLRYDVYIPGACKKCADSNWNQIDGCNRGGFADIVLTVEDCPTPGNCLDHMYVWEVKAITQDKGGQQASRRRCHLRGR